MIKKKNKSVALITSTILLLAITLAIYHYKPLNNPLPAALPAVPGSTTPCGDEIRSRLTKKYLSLPSLNSRFQVQNKEFSCEDLDNDGIEEITVNGSWDTSMGFRSELNPFHTKILKWKDGDYRDSSSEFIKYYQDQIDFRKGYLNILMNKLDNPKPEEILSMAVMNYLDNLEINKKDIGYDEFWKLTDINAWTKRIVMSETDKELINKVRQKIGSQ